MSPADRTSLSTRIGAIGHALGEDATSAAVSALASFTELFLTWNARINLGGVLTAEDLADHHLSDAFAAVRFVGAADRVVDVGSGGGLPSIPMALLRPNASFDLFEPTGKKVAFLRTAVRELGLGGRVRIHPSRVSQSTVADPNAPFDVACSRATFSPGEWVTLGLSLVRTGGLVLVFGTAARAEGCSSPDKEFTYGPNRRILAFRGVPRGT